MAENMGLAVAQGRPLEEAGPHISPERVVTDSPESRKHAQARRYQLRSLTASVWAKE
jgi:hypothetical protein